MVSHNEQVTFAYRTLYRVFVIIVGVHVNVFLWQGDAVYKHGICIKHRDRLSLGSDHSLDERLLVRRGIVLKNNNVTDLGLVQEGVENQLIAVVKGVCHRRALYG